MLKDIVMGFIIGLGKIVPGVSGAMIAMSFGIYNKIIGSILNPVKNIKFIMKLGIGFLIAIVLGSKIIIYLINNYYFITMIFFVILICGGIPKIMGTAYKKINIKKTLITLITFSSILFLPLIGQNNISIQNITPITIFIIGLIEAFTMIVPGISGTAVLMILGYYDIVMNYFSNILNLNLIIQTINFTIPFVLGMLVGVLLLSKTIKILLEKYETYFLSAISGLALGTIVMMIKEITPYISLTNIIYVIIISIIGLKISNKINN